MFLIYLSDQTFLILLHEFFCLQPCKRGRGFLNICFCLTVLLYGSNFRSIQFLSKFNLGQKLLSINFYRLGAAFLFYQSHYLLTLCHNEIFEFVICQSSFIRRSRWKRWPYWKTQALLFSDLYRPYKWQQQLHFVHRSLLLE